MVLRFSRKLTDSLADDERAQFDTALDRLSARAKALLDEMERR
jgi:hypothetical protein